MTVLASRLGGLFAFFVCGASQRLVIKNACETEPLWVAHIAGSGVGPDVQNLKIAAGQSFTFQTPDNLQATRYWPKMRCNSQGNQCQLGGSGGPQQLCDEKVGCAPPVDTKFEATFGQKALQCNPQQEEYTGCDYIDVSMVDGWTLPFKFEVVGNCSSSSGSMQHFSVDCSKLSVQNCPSAESVPGVGNLDLHLKHPTTGQISGCYSPCSKLTLRNWNNTLAMSHIPRDATAAPYCCPTPPESPASCRTGPVKSTQYVEAVHRLCPGVYGYSYDDGVGLLTCSATSIYTMSFFCPESEANPAEAVTELVV